MNLRIIPFLVLVACANPLLAQPAPDTPPKRAAAIKPGDVAPELKVAEWVKGSPITRFEPGKVYLVEYWATWCGPCIGNIPHLNALQKKYGKDGLVVIGMTNADLDEGATGPGKERNTLQQVRDFVAKQGDKMDYHVAYDSPMRETYKSMMGTIGGIPHAFLIGRDGKLALDYHPFYLDDAIRKVLDGTWNYDRDYPELRRSSKLYVEVIEAKEYAKFQASYGTLARDFPSLAKRMLDFKFNHALKAGDLATVTVAGRELIAAGQESGDARDVAKVAGSAAADLAVLQRSGLTGLVDGAHLQTVLTLVAEMAASAQTVSGGTLAAAFSAQAELAYGVEDLATAVEREQRAVALEENSYLKEKDEKRLAEFEKELAAQKSREENLRRIEAARAATAGK
ncbi:MAG: resA 4 [Lacunisphaera sp.]|nr:resA 4 [Lacunisphaera sp.]